MQEWRLGFFVAWYPKQPIFEWMFGETTISYIKIWNHPIETTIYTQMFQVPGGRLTRWSYTLGVAPSMQSSPPRL